MKLFDISLPLSDTLPVWPGDPPFQLRAVARMAHGDDCDVSEVRMSAHCGTHLDAPAHYFAQGATTDAIPLETLMGPADVLFFPNAACITAALLETAKDSIRSQRLLLKTNNSACWKHQPQRFQEDFCALSPDAADWIAAQKILLVGIDALSIEPYASADGAVHKILLQQNIIILEGLSLADVSPGSYQLACLPLALCNAEGAPCRAVLMKT